MRKKLIVLAALSTFVTSPAFAAETVDSAKTETSYKAQDDGSSQAKEKTESTDASGTTKKQVTTKDVDIDSKGNKSTTVQIKSSTDPKGLMNKTTTEIENKAVTKDGQEKYTHKKMIDGKIVEENNETHPQQ